MIRIIFLFSSLFAAEIQLGSHTIDVEIADTIASREKGLSGRTSLKEGTGMLFVYNEPQAVSFWMKDTLIPLSIGFFDHNQSLLQIMDMMPAARGERMLPLYKSPGPVKYALEVPLGWFKKNGVAPGAKFLWKNNSNPVN